jgi:hypothetical protein
MSKQGLIDALEKLGIEPPEDEGEEKKQDYKAELEAQLIAQSRHCH